ncbi:Response regulator receiver domain-containing protein [Dyadobacter soli]|uniref:Response regulator receiver domain-containing protein n=1 Tax=Dyadobacter soli TaxID=659014 RepID=A0A1G7XR49_9BACT|nr:response regulator [Dyadobacter soli]SDG86644.1 Response regulator receiver domain-containing protein [Dyadobacter soli]
MSPVTPLRILLADDDHDDTFLFQEALSHIPIETNLTVAENGMELLGIIKDASDKPDIIFLDMNMPIKNGLECLGEIRGTAGYEQVPIVILSTSVAQYLWESAYRNGANLYIQKPTSFNGLIAILKKCLLELEGAAMPEGLEQFLIAN